LLAAGVLDQQSGFPSMMLVGGEALTPAQWTPLAHTPRLTFYNGYGPTECTVDATVARAADLPECPNIGRPLANTLVFILNPKLHLTPTGVVGEIHIGGVGVARGYLNRPELTAERFIRDPFSQDAAARLYKSGDLARWLPDGSIEYLGRNDGQVKLRGYRIELGEIEAQLRRHQAVRDVAVVAREDEPGNKRLVAYFTSDKTLGAQELHEAISGRLPQYMLPSAYVQIEALPLTPNGKLDRKALPAPDLNAPLVGSYDPPRGEIETALANIWRDALQLDRIGRHDNFFVVGGNSLTAIQAVGLASRLGIRVSLKAIFEHQTVASLAASLAADLSAQRATRSSVSGVGMYQSPEAGSVSGDVPFTPVQLHAIQRDGDDFRRLATWVALKCQRPVTSRLVGRALKQLMIYHDALRLRVSVKDGHWTQAIVDVAEFRTESSPACEYLTYSSSDEIKNGIAPLLQRLTAEIDLSGPPTLRAALLHCEAESFQLLVLVGHHFATDPVSWPILVEDLQRIYEALESERSVYLPLKGASYKQWAESLRAYASSAAALEDVSYWQKISWRDCPQLPVDHSSGSVQESTCISVSLDQSATRALLSDASRIHGAHLNEILLAALANALSAWSGLPGFCVNVYHHGRVSALNNVEVSRTVGWFSAPVPLLVSARPGASITSTLRSVEQRLRTLPNEGVGHSILRHLREGYVDNGEPPLDVLLNHQGVLGSSDTSRLFAAQFDSEMYAEGLRHVDLPWKITVLSNVAHDRLNAHFVSRVYRQETLQSIADEFLRNLQDLLQVSRSVATAI